MNRNIAFFIASKNIDLNSVAKARSHFAKLANRYDLVFHAIEHNEFYVYLICEGTPKYKQTSSMVSFPVGNLEYGSLESDRFLKVTICQDHIDVENDYAGTIPTFYSDRNGLVLSNIEPAIVMATSTKLDDLDYESIYGYMHYMHYIWDETAYKHIKNIEPDSKYSFNFNTHTIKKEYLGSILATNHNVGLSDKEVADKLNELNNKLVIAALEKYDQIILPLSSGYDSRMILAALSTRPDLKEKLYCFTYGSLGSVEVEAARRLTSKLGIKWQFIDLPLRFLSLGYLQDIDNIFGASLHMHGMYQIEFFEEIKKRIKVHPNACLTSGFMTGVPAGQHISLISIDGTKPLTRAMDMFSQSKCWGADELDKLNVFKDKNYKGKSEERFKKGFDRFDGKVDQKSVMFDVWTRQRNFISYYPRTLEWFIPTVSPHMTNEYANFFMSLSDRHLCDRLAVELMFKYHHPELSKIVSNSNGLKSISSWIESSLFMFAKILSKLRLNKILPQKYSNNSFDFDLPALRNSGTEGVYPLLSREKKVELTLKGILSFDEIETYYKGAISGNVSSYDKLTGLQALAFSSMRFYYEC